MERFTVSLFARPLLFTLPALVALPAYVCTPAQAQSLATQKVQRAMDVLHFKPDAASQPCLDKLQELHKVQAVIEKASEGNRDPDLSLAHDVMESDYEDATESCVPDAAKLCNGKQFQSDAHFRQSCESLDAVMSIDGSTEGEEMATPPEGSSPSDGSGG
ncbi:hypothetical protein K6L44_02765 [Gluconacetobacter entanii]|uniref:Secreted protein n=1 Tax=Gluconacetobacter entanii TaxID=108528 RepID=A0A318PWB1_9PROT|nr:hypothetical protein [Gluconacetobacter entanii]NPC89924.1 hypothetical protein [Gluconacetobacter entanii]PYD64294.1 hypothetical protein CFR72_02235 [Gluconacetobacter entanii]